MDDPVLIVLTSGTTTLPKGCIHSNSTVASACERHKIIYWLDETRISCNHMPLFHLAGVMESLWAWAHGGTVVYPNKSFDAHATLEAIDKERCTDMSLVSSMLCALTDHPVLPNTNTSSLQLIKFNANAVTGSVARASHEILHARTVTNAFGMTETSCMTNVFAWKEGVCKDFEPFPVGCIAPGAKVRICAPGSHHPVKRGVIGELHLGGSTIADGYIGGSDDGTKFYSDEAGIWHVSGDQAIMAATGEITVLGRYKDVINRAGENISPSVLERVLNGVEGVQSAHVVGIPDEVAGEVPVAVIKMTEGKTVMKSLLHERVVKVLGTAFALERVIDLKELAVDDWPTTATAKVRKVDLREQVLQHLRAESKPSTQDTVRSSTEIVLTRIWARFTGIPEGQIAPTMSLKGIVDSVTVMRFRSRAKKELGRSLTLDELNANPTVAKQAAILDQQQESLPHSETSGKSTGTGQGPPELEDVVHAHGSKTKFDDIRQRAEKILHTLGLSWEDDVEEVLPIYDFLQDWRRSSTSLVYRLAFLSTKATTRDLRLALEATLSVHGMLRTLLVSDASVGPSWIMIRPGIHWFDHMIQDGGTLDTPEDLYSLDLSHKNDRESKDPEPVPLFWITMCFIESTQSAGFAVYGDHLTYDAHSILSHFVEDISKRLNDPGRPLPPRPKYSLFANSYHNYRSSVPAQLNIEYFASRLRGISQRRGALWPPKSSKSVNGPPERHAHHLLLKGNITPGLTGISKDIKLDMASNQYLTVHKIPHVIALKAAVAIYNTQQTGQPYAIIGTTHMARSYPFLERHITDHLPDIMDMPGCTLERPLSNLYIDPAATLSTILHSVHADQLSQSAHVQCPVFALRGRLPPEDAAFLANDVEGRQSFNYNPVITPDPGMPLKNIQFAGNANISIIWWCGMVDAETVKLRITWNEEVFGQEDAEKAMEGFERNLAWIVDGANWERRLGECG
ncbi:MAG: hypothetical protein Q9224_005159, partial [Gallowayella concinna]